MAEASVFQWTIAVVLPAFAAFACVQNPSDVRSLVAADLVAAIVTPQDGVATLDRMAALRVEFAGHLDPRRSDFERAIALSSGSFAVPVRVTYDPLDRVMTAEPVDPLRPGLTYVWEVDHERLRAAGGARVAAIPAQEMVVAPAATVISPEASLVVRWGDVAPIFDEHCGCHGDGVLLDLQPGALSGRSIAYPGRRLVAPYDASASYLVEKLLADYPDRYGTAMPPPWSEGPSIDDGDRRRIIEWINDGAAP